MNGTELFLVAVAMLVGVVGVFVPVIPGLLLIWGAGLWWAIATDGTLRWGVLALLTLMAVTGAVAKYVLGSRAVTRAGAPPSTVWFGLLGAVVGFFVIPVLGFVIGGILGVLLAEWSRLGAWGPAWRATWALMLGFGIGLAIELAAAIGMVLLWGVGVLLT